MINAFCSYSRLRKLYNIRTQCYSLFHYVNKNLSASIRDFIHLLCNVHTLCIYNPWHVRIAVNTSYIHFIYRNQFLYFRMTKFMSIGISQLNSLNQSMNQAEHISMTEWNYAFSATLLVSNKLLHISF